MRYAPTYTTPEAVHRQLSKADPSQATVTPAQAEYNDYYALIRDYVVQGSDYVTASCNRVFVPYRHTYSFPFRNRETWQQLRRRLLYLPDDLLVVNSATTSNGAISPDEYDLVPNYAPAWKVNFYNTIAQQSNDDTLQIDGTWGYVRDYTRAFRVVEDITGTLSASATTITVDDATAYELLQYLRINGEFLQVEAINTDTDVLTVSRGVNGTTPTLHTDYSIELFTPVPAVQLATTRLVAFLYQRRNDSASRVQYGDGSTIVNEQASIVGEIVKMYRRPAILSV